LCPRARTARSAATSASPCGAPDRQESKPLQLTIVHSFFEEVLTMSKFWLVSLMAFALGSPPSWAETSRLPPGGETVTGAEAAQGVQRYHWTGYAIMRNKKTRQEVTVTGEGDVYALDLNTAPAYAGNAFRYGPTVRSYEYNGWEFMRSHVRATGPYK